MPDNDFLNAGFKTHAVAVADAAGVVRNRSGHSNGVFYSPGAELRQNARLSSQEFLPATIAAIQANYGLVGDGNLPGIFHARPVQNTEDDEIRFLAPDDALDSDGLLVAFNDSERIAVFER